MLTNTFIHIRNIGFKTEERLWESGIQNWDSFTEDLPFRLSERRKRAIVEGIRDSRHQLQDQNLSFFSERLPSNQCWRIFPESRDSIVYLDIETTGLDRVFNDITTITLYDSNSIKTYVRGQNLDDFVLDIQKYKVIVTYNGKCFDIPFIESFFKIQLNHAHIDLRYILQSLGFTGGLKRCERQLGIDRGDLKEIDGFFAVLLWDEYQRTGDQKALETLLAYNVQDTVTLENLLVTAYNRKLQQTPFYDKLLIADAPMQVNPYSVDLETVDRIKNSPQYWQSQQWY
jgi:uncharacterized protein YprB with RNaseH-like and TPR domain